MPMVQELDSSACLGLVLNCGAEKFFPETTSNLQTESTIHFENTLLEIHLQVQVDVHLLIITKAFNLLPLTMWEHDYIYFDEY